MTIYEHIIKDIEDVCQSQPTIYGTATGSIYDILNGGKIEKYKAAILTPRNATIDNGWMTFNGVLFVVDRECTDGADRFARQGECIDVLHNIIGTLRDERGYIIEKEQYTPFSERFTDVCAGAYVTITITAPYGECTELY